jgi:hypothetical protein
MGGECGEILDRDMGGNPEVGSEQKRKRDQMVMLRRADPGA